MCWIEAAIIGGDGGLVKCWIGASGWERGPGSRSTSTPNLDHTLRLLAHNSTVPIFSKY